MSSSSLSDSSASSSAAKLLPLLVRKAIRDAEPETKKQLDLATTIIGSPVTFNYSFSSVWTSLDGHADQSLLLPSIVNEYLANFILILEKECYDPLTKDEVNRLWTSKNITFTVESATTADFNTREYTKTHIATTWEGYNGIRLTQDGTFDIYTRFDTFNVNVNHMYTQCKFAQLFVNVKPPDGELPLCIRKELIKEKDNIEKMKTRIATAVGVDIVEWDYHSDMLALLPIQPKIREGWNINFALPLLYLTSLAECLERHCKDDIVKEAIRDAFPAKKVKFCVYEKMAGQIGLEVHSSYNGIQFLAGEIIVFTTAEQWAYNVQDVARSDLIPLF